MTGEQVSPLEYCWLKVERAKEHRDALDKYIADTLSIESNRPRMGIKFEADTSEYVLFVNHMPELGGFISRCSILLGDAVHGLNSALDHLVYQLALLHTRGNIAKPNIPQLPICDTPELFASKKWRLQEVDPAHVALIERLQGYHALDADLVVGTGYFHPLSLLRDLVSREKHRLAIDLVIPLNGYEGKIGPFTMIFMAGMFQRLRSGTLFPPRPAVAAKVGAELMRTQLPTGSVEPDMQVTAYVPATVALDGDRSVVAALDKIAAVVVKIIREFEPFFQNP